MVYPVSVSLVIICIVHNKCTIRSLASIYVLVSCIDYIRSPAMAWYYVSRTRHLGRNCNSQFSGRDWSLPYAMPTWRIAYHPRTSRSVSRPVLPAAIFLVFNSSSEGPSVHVFIRGYNNWLFFPIHIWQRASQLIEKAESKPLEKFFKLVHFYARHKDLEATRGWMQVGFITFNNEILWQNREWSH